MKLSGDLLYGRCRWPELGSKEGCVSWIGVRQWRAEIVSEERCFVRRTA